MRHRAATRFRFLPIVTMLLPALFTDAAAAPQPVPAATPRVAEQMQAGLDMMHRGRFEAAETAFRAASTGDPTDPEPHLLLAFSYLWRIFQDRSDPAYDAPFREAIGRVLEAAEERLRQAPDDLRAQAAIGAAHIFDFTIQGMRRNYLKAAQAARRGHKILEAVVERDPGQSEAVFALGGYNYFSDRVPAIARGLLFIPSGDAQRGLDQLRAVASAPGWFHTEARLLLALILGSRDEHCFNEAEAHLDAALRENPGSPLILASLGSLRMRLGYYGEATTQLEQALQAANEAVPERERQRRAMRLLLAEALAGDFRLEEAEAELARAGGGTGPLTERDTETIERLRAEIDQKRGRPSWKVHQALTAWQSGRTDEALSLLHEDAVAFPLEPLPRFLSGRLLFLGDRCAEAEPELAAAAGTKAARPQWMDGWIAIYRGLAARAMGDETAALEQFRSAAALRRFKASDRATLELQAGRPPSLRCAR